MVACSVGPFPLAEFFNRFMPVHQELLTITLQETIISLEETSIDEADNISLRVETLLSQMEESGLCPSMTFRHILRPHDLLRPLAVCAFEKTTDSQESSQESQLCAHHLDFFVQVQSGKCIDPFLQESFAIPCEEFADLRTARRDASKPAVEVLSLQHRTHIFSISIVGRLARFVRWDAAGAVFTHPFDIIASPQHFAEFLTRYHHLSREQRGHDCSASHATPSERAQLQDVYRRCLPSLGGAVPAGLRFDDCRPVYKLSIDTNSGSHAFIVQAPFYERFMPSGRLTRCFVGWDVGSDQPVIVRDIWRPGPVLEAPHDLDHEIDEKLIELQVPGTARILHGSLVRLQHGQPQRTQTQDFPAAKSTDEKHLYHPELQVHTRLAHTFAVPLVAVQRSRDLVQAIHDALLALQHAFESGKILHRNISLETVMLTADCQHGVLSGWDHASSVRQAAVDGRTGTWPFISSFTLMAPYRPHRILDDVQSCFWLMFYVALLRFQQSGGDINVNDFNERSDVHDVQSITDGITGEEREFYVNSHVGGTHKQAFLQCFMERCPEFSSKPLCDLIRQLCPVLLKERHQDAYPIIEIFDTALQRSDWPAPDAEATTLLHRYPCRSIDTTAHLQFETLSKQNPFGSWSWCVRGAEPLPVYISELLRDDSSSSSSRSSTESGTGSSEGYTSPEDITEKSCSTHMQLLSPV